MNLVIAGAYYYDEESDTILIPHYTGEFGIVDCDEYAAMEDLQGRYDQSYIDKVKDDPIEYDGTNYYNSEYNPFSVGDWQLLSDLSELAHLEENFDF